MNKQIKRIQEIKIKHALNNIGGVLIEGPKWCGKTYLGIQLSKSVYYVQKQGKKNKDLLNLESSPIFIGEQPRLIDEWQIVPEIWDQVRYLIDINNNKAGMFILTGSSKPSKKEIIHSGAGRIGKIELGTLTFSEVIEDKKISLMDLFNQNEIKHVFTNKDIGWVARQIIKGGWPILETTNQDANFIISNYINTLIETDVFELVDMRINKLLFKNILKSIARLNTTQIKFSTVVNDLREEINEKTLYKYINILENLHIIKQLNVWSEKNRSKTAIRTNPKIYLCDSSIGLNLLSIKSEKDLYSDLNTFGIYFENQVIKDLQIYADALGGELFFYRNSNGFEIDAIMTLGHNQWAAIEIKLGDLEIDKAAKSLIKFASLYEIKPKFLLIITATNYSYQREDGVFVIPHTCLDI